MRGGENTELAHRRTPWRIRTYIFVLAGIVLSAQVVTTLYALQSTNEDTHSDARRAADEVAQFAAATIDADISAARSSVVERASAPEMADVAQSVSGTTCSLLFQPLGLFAVGHIEVIDANGTTVCTSAAAGLSSSQPAERASWTSSVLAAPTILGPEADPVTGHLAVVIGAPIAGGAGALVEFLDLDALGSGLAGQLGGGRYELLVTATDARAPDAEQSDAGEPDAGRVVTRSLDPARWAGTSLVDTPFSRAAGSDRTDLDGVRRIYGAARVAITGWTVYAGAERDSALALADRVTNRTLAISFGLLVLVLIAATVVFRRIVQPIVDLGGRVRAAATSGTFRRSERIGPNEVQGLESDFADLLARRETELDQVRHLAATNAAILGSSVDSVITIDHEGRIVEFNPAAELAFGYSRDEAVGQLMAEMVVPERMRDDHLRGLAHRLATDEGPILNQRVELAAMRRDGSEFPIELTVTKVDIPGSPLFTGYLRDLTAQVRARNELAASELRLQVILDNSPALVYVKDLDGRYTFVNRETERVLGLSRSEVLGHTDAELFPPELASVYRADDLVALRRATPLQVELNDIGPDGPRTYLAAKFSLVDAEGVAYSIAGISTDITERKRAEVERRFLQQRLDQSQRLESLGQLAGGVAHDFNNLLAVILIHAKFVADQTSGSVRDDVEQITVAAERAAGLTRQLLVFGRRDTVQTQPIDLHELVTGMRDVLSRGVGAQIDLVVDGEPGLPFALADRGQLEQVLFNLAINARDAMPEGGILTIRVGRGALLTAGEPTAGVSMTVTDTGSGMAPEIVARAFEPFFTTKLPGQGTGLGLATVYGIVTGAGGTIDIESTEGVGTSVRIVLPLANDPPVGASEHVVAAFPGGHGETVLVVDDEPALLAVTVRMLEDHGYDVISAGSGDEALTVAEGERIHLLLTDYVMPGMSGSRLAQRLRAERPDLAVLVMSGYSHDLSNHQRLDDDDLRLLRKPFTERELLLVVDEVLAGADGAVTDP